jgi:ribosomal protein S4
MRRIAKFKIYTKSKNFGIKCPSKILKFKRSKWIYYKSQLKKGFTRRFFFNCLSVSPKLKSWDRRKLFFKNSLLLKRQLFQLFDSSIKLKTLKNIVKTKTFLKYNSLIFFKKVFLNFEYNMSILLFRLNIFSSVFSARSFIERKLVLVNNLPVSHNYFLKRGDVISFNNTKFFLKNILDKIVSTSVYTPFIEVDMYSGRIIVIKDLKELSIQDASLIMSKPFPSYKLRNIN